jgi:Electron transfer DM13
MVSGFGAAAVLGFGAYLVFGFFAVQTLFVNETVDEAAPFVVGDGISGSAQADPTQEVADEPNEAEDGGDSGQVSDEPMGTDVSVVLSGEFIDRAHPTIGTVEIITDGDRRFLRFEGFETDNGPDLNVYLATGPPDGSPGEFVDLGDLKGNIGDQNYEIGVDIDLGRFTTVFIWCVRFSVAFGAATLS